MDQSGKNAAESEKKAGKLDAIIIPLALAQFVCSYAASAMNVAISNVAHDLGTTVQGVQLTISLFTLTMAALMIPGSKLTDMSGRKRIFLMGLSIYAVGALIATVAPALGVMIFGYSILEGLGTALLIPPVYILVTASYTGLARAKNFGIVSAAAGIGAAAGPLIGGTLTSAISWRASFVLQFAIVILVIVLGMRITEPKRGEAPTKHNFDFLSAILSGVGFLLLVIGFQSTSIYGWLTAAKSISVGSTVIIPQGSVSPFIIFAAVGVLLEAGFYLSLKHRERVGKEPLIQTRIFHNRTSNLGLITQNVQWLIMQGTFFSLSVAFQTVRHFSAIETGLILTASTVGLLLTSGMAARLARVRTQRLLIRGGFVLTIIGTLLLFLGSETSPIVNFIPGLFLIGCGIGIMLTSSVNVVQSAFPEKDQGEISGLSRSISNLGSSFGVAIVGSIIASSTLPKGEPYGLAILVMVVIAFIGLGAAILIPKEPRKKIEKQEKQNTQS